MNIYIIILVCLLIIGLVITGVFMFSNSETFTNKLFVDDIYIIYLQDRLNHVQQLVNDLNIEPIYFNAIWKDDLNIQQLEKNKIIDSKQLIKNGHVKNGSVNKGVIGCALSHLTVLKNFLKSNKKIIMVMEDDISFNKEYKNFEILDNVPKDFEYINLQPCYSQNTKKFITPNILSNDYSLCTGCYIITRSGAKKILNHSKPLTRCIDGLIRHLLKKHILKGYSISPPLFFQDNSNSTIQ